MNPTATNALVVIGLFGGALAICIVLSGLERLGRRIGQWLKSGRQ